MSKRIGYSYESIMRFVSDVHVSLEQEMTVADALDYIRSNVSDEKIIYFYIVDIDGKLLGVVSTRKLLISPLETRMKEIMDQKIRHISSEAKVLDVWAEFIIHKYLALPVVDKHKRLVGVVDVSVFTENIGDIMERDRTDEVFEIIGFKLSQVKNASAFRVFRYRFPWLSATIISGVVSAIMASRYELVLAQSIILAFFLTLVLGLGESVSMQTMTVTIQTLKNIRPTVGWYLRALAKELQTAVLLGLASGISVSIAILVWQGALLPAAVIGGSIVLTISVASLIGLTIPSTLHILNLDLKIASGPLTLALADLSTILIYFTIASAILK